MQILLVHPNFPSQLRSMAVVLGGNAAHDVRFLTKNPQGEIAGVKKILYAPKRKPNEHTHHYIREFEERILEGQAAYEACLKARNEGFYPKLIFGHAGWGTTLFLRDVFPMAKMALNFEWFYKGRGSDCDFDPSDPVTPDIEAAMRVKNSTLLTDLASADAGLCPTQFQYEQYPEHLRSRLIVSHEGIDTGFFRPDPDAKLILSQPTPENPENTVDLSGHAEIVTYATRGMEPYRGFPQFIEAIHYLLKNRPKTHVVIAGDDRVAYGRQAPGGKTYKQLMLEKFPLDEERVHFVGSLPYGQYLRLLQCTKAHVYLTRPFVLSWSLMEAMSCEALVVASDTAPVREVITDGINGLLVDFFRPDLLAAKLNDVLENQEKFRNLRVNARKTIEGKYEINSCLRQRLDWLSSLLNR